MCAYLMGLKGDPLTASTMAFATICLARLLHGFNCRSDQPLTKIGLFSNRASIGAFIIGFTLLHIILFIPFMHSLFMIHTISFTQLLCIYGCLLYTSYHTSICRNWYAEQFPFSACRFQLSEYRWNEFLDTADYFAFSRN